ncbi:MAG: DUF4262 domain-containing protein [Anaeromyxobacteraceae bacterium]
MLSDGARVCRHVADGDAPILHARRVDEGGDADAEFRFWCGARAHDACEDRVFALEEIVARDPSAVEIVLHPRGTGLGRAGPLGRWHTEQGPLLFPALPSRRFPTLEPRYPPRPNEPLDAGDLLVLAEVADHGWHVVRPARDAQPLLAHTVGLFRNQDHPELCVLGQPPGGAVAMLDRLAREVFAGMRFEPGDLHEDPVTGRRLALVAVSPRLHGDLVPLAVWYHGGARFPLLQAVWPDPEGRYPWERWSEPGLRGDQPVLLDRDPA